MDILASYECRKAETKQIVLGGIEDDFDPAGIELSSPSEKQIRYIQEQRNPKNKSEIVKTYDDPRQDRLFSDRFNISKRVYHGLVVLRLEELSGLKNDGITMGFNPDENLPYINAAYGYTERVSNLAGSRDWTHHDSLYFASLDDLKLRSPSEQKETLLDVIRSQAARDGDFFVDISDDTVVDFIGFALCLEPEKHNGTVYSLFEPATPEFYTDLGPGYVGLYTGRVDGEICNYGGCLSCEEKRPVSCIHDSNMPVPKDHDLSRKLFWTGGEIRFTKAVKGSSFATEDDVDQFCAAEFGSEWRSLSRHDGHWTGNLSGKGTFPPDYENVWVNVKDSDHHNCWKTRPDYEQADGE